jgi:hypothetical protein
MFVSFRLCSWIITHVAVHLAFIMSQLIFQMHLDVLRADGYTPIGGV